MSQPVLLVIDMLKDFFAEGRLAERRSDAEHHQISLRYLAGRVRVMSSADLRRSLAGSDP